MVNSLTLNSSTGKAASLKHSRSSFELSQAASCFAEEISGISKHVCLHQCMLYQAMEAAGQGQRAAAAALEAGKRKAAWEAQQAAGAKQAASARHLAALEQARQAQLQDSAAARYSLTTQSPLIAGVCCCQSCCPLVLDMPLSASAVSTSTNHKQIMPG